MLHDVGKMDIPLEVMDKPTKLGIRERELRDRLEKISLSIEIDALNGFITRVVANEKQQKIKSFTDSHINMQGVNVGYGEAIPIVPEENEGNIEYQEEILEGTYIGDEKWSELLKGGSNMYQLEYLLGIAKYCKDNENTDYLETALKWMCYTDTITNVYEPIAQAEDGSLIFTYDVVLLNEMFSLLTEEKISEEHLYFESSINGNELICVYPDAISLEEGVSLIISSGCYVEDKRIRMEGLYSWINLQTGLAKQEYVVAYLIPDEDGKYILDYVE